MTSQTKERLIRWVIFIGVSVGLFVLLSPFMYVPRTILGTSVTLADVGVAIQTGQTPDTFVIRVDDQEETIPREKLGQTPVSTEAMRRISGKASLGRQYLDFSWHRFFRSWCPLVVLAYWFLFRVWQPRREYVEGGPV